MKKYMLLTVAALLALAFTVRTVKAQVVLPPLLPTNTQVAAMLAAGPTLDAGQTISTIKSFRVGSMQAGQPIALYVSWTTGIGNTASEVYKITQAQLVAILTAGAALPSGEVAANGAAMTLINSSTDWKEGVRFSQ